MSTALVLSATGPLLAHAIYLATGALAGFLAGLLGIGGGLVMVPALLICFSLAGLPAEVIAPLALGTSLTAVGFASALASREHFLAGNLRQPFSPCTLLLAGWLVCGVVAGGALSTHLPGSALLALIGVFQILVAIRMAVSSASRRAASASTVPAQDAQDRLKRGAGPFLLFTGGISAIGGIGGATLMIPYFTHVGIDYRRAAALSTFFGAIVGGSGFVAYALLARPPQALPWTLGYVSLPAFASLAAGSLLLVRHGARLSTRLSSVTLTRAFCAFLLVSGTKLLLAL